MPTQLPIPATRPEPPARNPRRWRRLLPPAVLLAGAVASVFAGWFAHRISMQRSEQHFDRLCDRVSMLVYQRMQVYRYGLAAARGLFVARDQVLRGEFRAYVRSRDLPNEFPGSSGFGFIERVPRDRLDYFLAATRSDGDPEFRVHGTNDGPELYIVKFMEPSFPGHRAIGLDIAGEAVRREAADRAMLSGQAALSGPVTLVHRQREGLLYLLPVYRGGVTPPTPEQRRAKLLGWVFTPLSIDEAMCSVLAQAEGQVKFDVLDAGGQTIAPDAQDELYDGDAGIGAADQWSGAREDGTTFSRLVSLRVGQRDWKLRIRATPAFAANLNAIAPWQAGGASAALSVLLAGLVWSMGRAHTRAVALAGEMTAALKASRDEVVHQAGELVRRGAELEVARLAAEAASHAKSDFLANVSHEIRTPMGAIIGYADLMMDPTQTPEERNRCVQVIRRNGEHLLAVLNDILDVSKIEAGQFKVERLACCPCSLVADIASLMRARAVEKGLAFDVRYVGAVPRNILTDPTRLRQILLNLLSNAIKFTPAGRVQMLVRMIGNPRDALLQFQVHDTGIGITAEQQERLFQAFAQADVSTTRKYGGTGLGLTISQRLASMLGGTLTLASTPGVGTSFSLAIPLGDVSGCAMEDRPDEVHRSDASAGRDGMVASPRESASLHGATPLHLPRVRGRILLAEDGDENRKLVTLHLLRAGAEVVAVTNGLEAVEHARSADEAGQPFELILMDMQMPELDGYSAASTLRARGYRRPIVALTAHAMGGDREKCLLAGCDDYLTKPIDRGVLLAAVAKYLPPADGAPADPSSPLASAFQNDAQLTEALAEFVAALPAQVAQLDSLSRQSDLQALRNLAHTIKGAGGGYGFPQITALAGSLENAIKTQAGLDSVRDSVAQLTSLIRRVEGYRRDMEVPCHA